MSDPSETKAGDLGADLNHVVANLRKLDEVKPALFQFHWQNLKNIHQTEFVAQGSFSDPESVQAWIEDICKRRGNECPEGWCSLICTEDSDYFVRAAEPVIVQGQN